MFDSQALLASQGGFDPDTFLGGDQIILSGPALDAFLSQNLEADSVNLLFKYDDASEANPVLSAIWIDSLQNGASPPSLVISYSTNDVASVFTINGDYTQRSGSTLELSLGLGMDDLATTQKLVITGTAEVLGSDFIVSADELFDPTAGDQFEIVEFGVLDGEFDSITIPELPQGLMWQVQQMEGDLSLLVTFVGDYNGDGVVDGGDYAVWRNLLGTSVAAGTSADGDGDGVVGAGDLAIWKANVGATLPLSASQVSATPAPEPASITCFAFLLVTQSLRRRGSTLFR